MKVLWLSPMLNHYKARFLDRLQEDFPIELTVLAGTGRDNKGDFHWNEKTGFTLIQVPVSKKKFGLSRQVRKEIEGLFQGFDWVILPKENKNLLLFIFLLNLKKKTAGKGKNVGLFTYNHPIVTEGPKKEGFFRLMVSKFYYRYYDKVIFYTEAGCQRMIDMSYISSEKAYYANNTIDTVEVNRHYCFEYPDPNQPTILFIGRLIPSKRLGDLISYYRKLKTRSELRLLKLIVIGDGPESHVIEKAMESDSDIDWVGTVVDEEKIAPFMSQATLVFVPGHSGLSINHAFSYGRPFVTLGGIHQPPEIDYLQHGINGLILKGNSSENIDQIGSMLINFDAALYDRCYETGKDLSVGNWCKQIVAALEA
ncbi:glycosyltransferase family 4 protein [Bacteroidota bacterium]